MSQSSSYFITTQGTRYQLISLLTMLTLIRWCQSDPSFYSPPSVFYMLALASIDAYDSLLLVSPTHRNKFRDSSFTKRGEAACIYWAISMCQDFVWQFTHSLSFALPKSCAFHITHYNFIDKLQIEFAKDQRASKYTQWCWY